VGFDKSCEDLGIPATNAWVAPSWDIDKNADDFLKGNGEGEMPIVFIGSNAAKDGSYKKRYGANRGSIMVLAPVNYNWFKEWERTRVHARGDDYDKMKKFWSDKLFKALYAQYPQLEGHVVFDDLGTPLSNNFYLGTKHGEVYGLTHTTDRTWEYAKELSVTTNIKNLYITGQDVMTAGVTAALFSGFMTVASISGLTALSHLHNVA
jgi:all-trans-retinol 13,14-reductase